MAMGYIKTNPNVNFIFVDINCSLCIRFKNGQFRYFNSHEQLVNLVDYAFVYFIIFFVLCVGIYKRANLVFHF